CCTIDQDAFYSARTIEDKSFDDIVPLLDGVEINEVVNGVGAIVKFVKSTIPGIVVEKTKSRATIVVNDDKTLSFYVCPNQPGCSIETLKIGNEQYTYDENEKKLIGNYENVGIVPELRQINRKVIYTNPNNNSNASVTVPVFELNLSGVHELNEVSVQVSSVIKFTNSVSTGKHANVNSDYVIDVKENTCTDIKFEGFMEDTLYVAGNESKKYTIAPDFVGTLYGERITDIPEWKIINGGDILSNPKMSADKMSYEFSTISGKYGEALVELSAGSVTKRFYIKSCSPINNISLGGSVKDMPINSTQTMSGTFTFAGKESDYTKYPDTIIVKASNESVISISNIKIDKVNMKFTYDVSALDYGYSNIEIRSASGKFIATQRINVISSNLKVLLYDADGNSIHDGDDIYIRGTNGIVLSYDFTDEVSKNDINMVTDIGKKLNVKSDTTQKKIYLEGREVEKTNLTIYPIDGSVDNNSIKVTVHVDADIQKIVLRSASIEVGNTRNVLSYMYNEFGEDYRLTGVRSYDDYALITDNYIEFKSSNESCVTVDDCGNVTAIKAPSDGTKVSITCTAYHNGKKVTSATTNVSVVGGIVETTTPNNEQPTTAHVENPTNGNGGESAGSGNGEEKTSKQSSDSSNNNGTNNNQQSGNNNSVGDNNNNNNNNINNNNNSNDNGNNNSNNNSNNGSAVNNDSSNNQNSQSVNVPATKIKKALRAKNNKQIKVTYKSVSGANYYEVSYSTSKNFKKGTKTKKFKKTSAVLKKLSKKKYFIRVRAVKLVNGQKYFSKWSSKKTVKVKK
ncbi:MAG: hypothetical protein K6G88_10005, partial [Lachnospiraceae bacterium]|nr:hypothetical protein [Lachnospiraceae bacterium]